MKALARSHVWWPNVDQQIEERVKSCAACQANKNTPPKAPLHPWAWPTAPWLRVHVDFAGPIWGKMLMVVTDAHSKWPEVIVMTSTTAGRTIAELRNLFARYGIPEQVVTDNGPQFASEEFGEFMRMNGVKRALLPVPSSNKWCGGTACSDSEACAEGCTRRGSSSRTGPSRVPPMLPFNSTLNNWEPAQRFDVGAALADPTGFAKARCGHRCSRKATTTEVLA